MFCMRTCNSAGERGRGNLWYCGILGRGGASCNSFSPGNSFSAGSGSELSLLSSRGGERGLQCLILTGWQNQSSIWRKVSRLWRHFKLTDRLRGGSASDEILEQLLPATYNMLRVRVRCRERQPMRRLGPTDRGARISGTLR